jgi:hypothetical protein
VARVPRWEKEKSTEKVGAEIYALSTSYRNSNIPGGCPTPCPTTRIPTRARRVPACVRTRTRSWSSSTPLVTSTTPCTRLPATWASIWIVRAGSRGRTPRWTWGLHTHLGWNLSTLDGRHIRSRLNGENQIREFGLQLTKSLGGNMSSVGVCIAIGASRTFRTTSCGLTLPTVSTSK